MTTTAVPATPRRKRIVKSTVVIPKVLRVPEQAWLDSYISRDLDDGYSDFQIGHYCTENGINLLLEGPTGPGKTSFVMALAAKHKGWFFSVPSAGNAEPSQLFGKYVPDGKGGWVWQDGPVTYIIRNGGYLLINEINFMPPSVMSVLFGLLDKRREIVLLDKDGEVVRAHRPTQTDARGNVTAQCWCDAPGDAKVCRPFWVTVVADMNPGYEGTRPLNKALLNRFGVKVFWDYDEKVEKRLVLSESLLAMAKQLRTDQQNGKYQTPVSTNMLQDFETNLVKVGANFATTTFVNAYPHSDRSTVRLVVNTHLANIKREIKKALKGPVDGLPDFTTMTEEEIYEWRLTLKPGDVDPEWGIFLTDWEWNEGDGPVEEEDVL